jgi:hypothetical protein
MTPGSYLGISHLSERSAPDAIAHTHNISQILAAARRAAAEATAEAACAEAASQAAGHKAEHATAQAERYHDAALNKAASIITEARTEASRIIEEAWAEASRITWNRGAQYAPARRASPTHGNSMRLGARQLQNIEDLVARLEDVNKKLALPIRTISINQSADAEPANVPPVPTASVV